MSISQESPSATFGEVIRDLLLAMVSSQNEANASFIDGIEELAGTNVTISYKKDIEGKAENREITGNALSFGILPTLLHIQSGVIEIRTAMTVTSNPEAKTRSAKAKSVKNRADYLFKTETVDAKYQNSYSYKTETSSLIRITVVPTPPPQPLIDAIKAVTDAAPAKDNKT